MIDDATPSDILAVARDMRQRDFEEFRALSPLDDRAALAAAIQSRLKGKGALVARHGGAPVCIGMAHSQRPNVVTASFFATDAFPSVAVEVTRFIRRQFVPRLFAAGFHRIEVASLATYPEMHRWLRVLGFRQEGEPMRNYGKAGEAFVTFVRFPDVRPSGA